MNSASGIDKDARSYRLTNIDMLRGLVIVIMALDHVRDFFMMGGVQDPMSQADVSPGLYFTRWVTHFCAPVFVYLAGTSVGLMAARKSANELAGFLFKRGLWLIFVEVAIISTAVTFSPLGEVAMGGAVIVILQVIWVLGVGMVVLAGAQYLGEKFCLIVGGLILLCHNLLDAAWPSGNIMRGSDPFWTTLHTQGSTIFAPFLVNTIYPLLPWVGLILVGYGSAFVFRQDAKSRDRILMFAGISFIALFIILRFVGIYGEPNPWQSQEQGLLATFFDFMNVSKYPPSLLFTLITLGPMAIICSLADRWQGWWKDTLIMFGRVPFAFYVAHFYLIHILAIGFGVIQGFEASQFMHIFFLFPEGYGTNLIGVYIVWLLVLIILYPFCRWMSNIKRNRKDWWLSYL